MNHSVHRWTGVLVTLGAFVSCSTPPPPQPSDAQPPQIVKKWETERSVPSPADSVSSVKTDEPAEGDERTEKSGISVKETIGYTTRGDAIYVWLNTGSRVYGRVLRITKERLVLRLHVPSSDPPEFRGTSTLDPGSIERMVNSAALARRRVATERPKSGPASQARTAIRIRGVEQSPMVYAVLYGCPECDKEFLGQQNEVVTCGQCGISLWTPREVGDRPGESSPDD